MKKQYVTPEITNTQVALLQGILSPSDNYADPHNTDNLNNPTEGINASKRLYI